jgi:DNA polymerase-3 subunit delta'
MGANARFFDANDLPKGGTLSSLTVWSQALAATRRTVEHPFNASLMVEALVAQAQNALNSN